jgi:hypothetical protein
VSPVAEVAAKLRDYRGRQEKKLARVEMLSITPRSHYHRPSRARCGISRLLQCANSTLDRTAMGRYSDLWSSWALREVPGRTVEDLQRHHTSWQITSAMLVASSDAIRPGRLGAFPPAREDLHTRSSVVAGPCSANMLAHCLFAAYSMLRRLTCTGWP